jgi:hypothetical protein
MIVLLQRNVVFFKTVSAAVHDQAHDGVRTMRIGEWFPRASSAGPTVSTSTSPKAK